MILWFSGNQAQVYHQDRKSILSLLINMISLHNLLNKFRSMNDSKDYLISLTPKVKVIGNLRYVTSD